MGRTYVRKSQEKKLQGKKPGEKKLWEKLPIFLSPWSKYHWKKRLEFEIPGIFSPENKVLKWQDFIARDFISRPFFLLDFFSAKIKIFISDIFLQRTFLAVNTWESFYLCSPLQLYELHIYLTQHIFHIDMKANNHI